jgi:hypothetical protein
MIVHSLLLDMFAGKIRNPQELKDALNAEPLGTAASSWGE